MIDEKLTAQLLEAIDTFCDEQLKGLEPLAKDIQQAYDYGTFTGIKIMIKRLRKAIDTDELNPSEYNKDLSATTIMNSDRKVFVMKD